MKFSILTNNPTVLKKLGDTSSVTYEDVGFAEILIAARDLIQKGHKLLSHPLAGNLRPKQSPYKSLLLSASPGETDPASVVLIEDCIHFCEKHPDTRPNLPDSVLEDFQLVDFSLIESAIEGIKIQ